MVPTLIGLLRGFARNSTQVSDDDDGSNLLLTKIYCIEMSNAKPCEQQALGKLSHRNNRNSNNNSITSDGSMSSMRQPSPEGGSTDVPGENTQSFLRF